MTLLQKLFGLNDWSHPLWSASGQIKERWTVDGWEWGETGNYITVTYKIRYSPSRNKHKLFITGGQAAKYCDLYDQAKEKLKEFNL